MSSFCSLCIPLSAYSAFLSSFLGVCVCVCVCEVMLQKDQNKGFMSEVGTFWLLVNCVEFVRSSLLETSPTENNTSSAKAEMWMTALCHGCWGDKDGEENKGELDWRFESV